MITEGTIDQIYDVLDEGDLTNSEVLSLIGIILVNIVLDADVPGESLDEALGSLRRFVCDVIAHPAQRGGDYQVGVHPLSDQEDRRGLSEEEYRALMEEADMESLRVKVLFAGIALLMEEGMSRAEAEVKATRLLSGGLTHG